MGIGITVSFMNYNAVFVTDVFYDAGLCRDIEVSRLSYGDLPDMGPAFFFHSELWLEQCLRFSIRKRSCPVWLPLLGNRICL